MTRENWHQRGCALIGTDDPATMTLADGVPTWVCCGAPAESNGSGDVEDMSLASVLDPVRVHAPTRRLNVEHPAVRLAERAEQARKLDGWVTATMRIEHPETRASVLESLSAHIARTGQVP